MFCQREKFHKKTSIFHKLPKKEETTTANEEQEKQRR
jgi:hypothetical protein